MLLPLSGGLSSLSLLHVVDRQLQRQSAQSRGRTAYELHVLIIHSNLLPCSPEKSLEEKIKERYPSHTVSAIPLSSIAELDPEALDAVDNPSSMAGQSETIDTRMDRMFHSLGNPTAKADILEVLLIRLIVAFGTSHGCESVFWGHSDSRLAAKALSTVAKGRGSAIPFHLLDGPTPFGLAFNFPVCDLFKTELDLFSMTDSTFPLDFLVPEQPASKVISVRDLSIDQLLTNYITSQGEKYPSIMANVVRTAGKLHAPEIADSPSTCTICRLLIDQHQPSETERPLCYGCSRSLGSIKSNPT